MAEPVNALAPKVTGVNRLVDWLAQKADPKWFSTAGRTLLETAQGKRDPITEAHFSPEELDIMRQLAAIRGGNAGAVSYEDYGMLAKRMANEGNIPMSASPSLLSMADPLGNVQTTLGRFRYERDPKGNLQIVDTYDFNPIYAQGSMQEAQSGDYGALSPYGLIRSYAGEKIPPGYGRQVRINLGK